ncbi:MAG: GNAT family N-acetyltransferase [Anaerolineales bacterium]|nr:GNAT family N-acetyltransferase [Anaerolineales bacterium]
MAFSTLAVPIETSLQLLPASAFTIEQLTAAYNQTRVDYLVPMPMNAARLAEYIATYDVSLEDSVVALDGNGQMLGLAMLGVRPERAWVTRLGVLPAARRRHIGLTLMNVLLGNAEHRGLRRTVLEVIKNNIPAYNLFIRCGFAPTQEYLVLRRPPAPPLCEPRGSAEWLDREAALALLPERADTPSWITENRSLARVESLQALIVTAPDVGSGWLVFQEQRFRGLTMLLSRFMLHTRTGSPPVVARLLLAHLYRRYPELDTQIENVAVSDPHLPMLIEMGFIESFRRIEMIRDTA